MKILSKCIRTVLAGIIVFMIMTIAGAALLRFTPVSENWGYWIVIAALSAACFVTGIYMGSSYEKWGLLIGLMTSAMMIMIICLLMSALFADSVEIRSFFNVWHAVPLFSGTVGGIVGVNIKK